MGTKKTTKRKAAPKKAAKKAVKKAAPKKAKKTAKKAAKKPAVKETKEQKEAAAKKAQLQIYKLATDVPQEKYFVLANGQPVKHVAELATILDGLEDHIFAHHVNPERNDFHNWVKEVFKDVELAKKMLGVDSKQNLQLTIYKHVAHKAFEGK